MKPASVLIIGSGPIVIGQAAEFDYAGTQACKAMREEGVRSILVNSNPATIMTDLDVADAVYIEPLTVPVLERIIARERPGGPAPDARRPDGTEPRRRPRQAREFSRSTTSGCSARRSRRIRRAEDRELFRDMLAKLGEPVLESEICHTVDECVAAAEKIGLPVVIRPGLHARRHRRRHGLHDGAAAHASPRAAWQPARSRRCSSKRTCSAGKRSNTR